MRDLTCEEAKNQVMDANQQVIVSVYSRKERGDLKKMDRKPSKSHIMRESCFIK